MIGKGSKKLKLPIANRQKLITFARFLIVPENHYNLWQK
jgi:hypothetical protein